MTASLPTVIRAHVAELGGCPTILLHPDDYARHWAALCDIALDMDETVPRGCYRIEHATKRQRAA